MHTPLRPTATLALAGAIALLATSCASGTIDPAENGVHVSVAPRQVWTSPSGSVAFSAVVTGTMNTAVEWTVLDTGGGSIDAGGNYVAPADQGAFRIVARSLADRNVAATATVNVSSAPPPPTAECATAEQRGAGTVHYYCACGDGASSGCRGGDDANEPCTDPNRPCSSLQSASSRMATMPAGHTVAFCRTGAWTGYLGNLAANGNCTAGSPCDVRDYVPAWGSTASPRPVFNTAGSNFLWWDSQRSNVFHGGRVWNLDVRMTPGGSETAFYAYAFGGQVSDIDICNVTTRGGNAAFYWTGEYWGPGNITVRSSQIFEAHDQGHLGGATGLTYDSNYWENNGWRTSPQSHTMYFAGAGSTPMTGMRFTNNDVVTDGRCGGVMVVIHGLVPGLTVENNRVRTTSTDANCQGIQSDASAAPYARFTGSVFRRNRVTTNGSSALDVSGCPGCTVSDNVAVGGRIGVGISAGASNLEATTNVVVQNNTVYEVPWVGIQVSSGSGHVVENNAVFTSTGSCYGISGAARQGSNYCRTQGGAAAASVFANAATGDFRPAAGGPLAGTGDASSGHFSANAIGSVVWSPADAGAARAAPVSMGAMLP